MVNPLIFIIHVLHYYVEAGLVSPFVTYKSYYHQVEILLPAPYQQKIYISLSGW